MEAKFDRYFNQVLKTHLKYPETFKIYLDTGRITLIPNQKSRLLELIKSDRQLKYQLLDQIAKVLSDVYPIGTVDFLSHGDDIIIDYSVSLTDIPIKEIGVYANIAKNLSIIEIDKMCRTNRDFNKACRNPSFWKLLVQFQFPQFYREDIKNWEKVYRGLIWYTVIKDEPFYRGQFITDKKHQDTQHFWVSLQDMYPEALKVLILNKIKLSQDQLDHILAIFSINYEINLIKHILDNYKIDYSVLFSKFEFEFNMKNVRLMELYLNYRGIDELGNEVKLTKEDVEDVYDSYLEHGGSPNIEEFKILYDFFDGSYTPDSLLNELAKILIIKDELLEYIIDKLPDDPKNLDISNQIIDMLNSGYGIKQAKALIKRYKSYLQQDDIDNIISTIEEAVDDEIEQEELLNLLT